MNSDPPDAVVEWWRRHPSLATLAAVAAVLVLAAGIAISRQRHR